MTHADTVPRVPRLNASGVVRLTTVVLTLVVTAALFFIGAGTLRVTSGWVYYGGLIAYLVVASAVLLWRFPEVVETINARGKLNRDVKAWDKLFAVAYSVLVLVSPVVAGLDVGHLRTLAVPRGVTWAALVVSILAYAFVHWAMIVNRHAETGVRIQEDRGHQVVSSGPYRFVRHPFYIAIIVTQLLYPLAVGSLWAYAPALLCTGLFVWRTAREDGTLRRELPGYETFTQQTRYRLVPGVW